MKLFATLLHKSGHAQCGLRFSSTFAGQTMKALQLTSYGHLSLNSIPIPSLSKHELLVKVKAASLNPLDLQRLNGYGKHLFETQQNFPVTLGLDGSGVVVDIGPNVWNFNPGDSVWMAVHPFKSGTIAEYCVVSEFSASLKPPSLDFKSSACIPFRGVTAWQALKHYGNLKENQTVLILGGFGGVGRIAISLCKNEGCKVYATCSSENISSVLSLGADRVLDYRDEESFKSLERGMFDLVLDAVGESHLESQSIPLITGGGQFVTLRGNLLKAIDQSDELFSGATIGASELMRKKYMYAKNDGVGYNWALFSPDGTILDRLGQLVEKGIITPRYDQVLDFETLLDGGLDRFVRKISVVEIEK